MSRTYYLARGIRRQSFASCPANSYADPGAAALTDCICKPGYGADRICDRSFCQRCSILCVCVFSNPQSHFCLRSSVHDTLRHGQAAWKYDCVRRLTLRSIITLRNHIVEFCSLCVFHCCARLTRNLHDRRAPASSETRVGHAQSVQPEPFARAES